MNETPPGDRALQNAGLSRQEFAWFRSMHRRGMGDSEIAAALRRSSKQVTNLRTTAKLASNSTSVARQSSRRIVEFLEAYLAAPNMLRLYKGMRIREPTTSRDFGAKTNSGRRHREYVKRLLLKSNLPPPNADHGAKVAAIQQNFDPEFWPENLRRDPPSRDPQDGS